MRITALRPSRILAGVAEQRFDASVAVMRAHVWKENTVNEGHDSLAALPVLPNLLKTLVAHVLNVEHPDILELVGVFLHL